MSDVSTIEVTITCAVCGYKTEDVVQVKETEHGKLFYLDIAPCTKCLLKEKQIAMREGVREGKLSALKAMKEMLTDGI